MMRPYVGSWKHLAVHGVAAVLFGLATLVWPAITLWALVLLWGAFALVDGITAVAAAITDRLLVHRGREALLGFISIAAGVITLVWPSITAVALLMVIAVWAFVAGGARIAFAIEARKQLRGMWVIALGGLALVLLGAVLVIDPGTGALGLTWAIGWLAIAFGAQELWLASVVHAEQRELASPAGARSSAAVAG